MNEKVLFFLCACFFCSLYISPMDAAPVAVDACTGALFVYSLVAAGRAWGKRVLENKVLLLWVLFYAWTLLSAALSGNRAEAWSYVVLRAPLLLFPLSVGTWRLTPAFRDKLLKTYALVTTLASVACLVYAFLQYRRTGDSGWLYDDSLSFLSSIQSVYMALMVEIALLIFGYFSRRSRWMYACMAFLVVFQFMLASRTGIILFYSLVLALGIWHFGWKKGLGLVAIVGVLGLTLVAFFPKTLNRFRELQYSNYHYESHAVESHYNMQVTPDQWNGANIRLAVWRCAWAACRDHLWTGVPIGDKRDTLVGRYEAVHFDFAVQSRRATHNTYLDVLMTFGVGGLLLFLAAFVVGPLALMRRRRDLLGALVIVLFVGSMATETYLDRSLGCILLGFFYAFFLGINRI